MSSAKSFKDITNANKTVTTTTTITHVKLLAAAKISQWHKGVDSQSDSQPVVLAGDPCRDGLYSYFKRGQNRTEDTGRHFTGTTTTLIVISTSV